MKTFTLTLKNLLYANIRMILFISGILISLQSLWAQQPKYNVLFIAVDDMNDRLNFLGNPEVVSPNLQRLVNHGMLFTKAYTQYPLCSPSRTSILSGWRPDHNQIYSNDVRPATVMGNVLHLPEFFHGYGYRTERYGKIAHDLYENDITWDYAEPGEKSDGGDNSGFAFSGFNGLVASNTATDWWIQQVPDSALDDGIEARHLVTRLHQPATAPFFYALGFHSPHSPFTPGLTYWNKNGDPSVQEFLPVNKSGTLSSNFKGNGSGNIILPGTPANDRADIPKIAFSNIQESEPDSTWRKIIHAYDGEVAQLDAQLGLVLDELDRQNLWSNTIIVFWSDHGLHLGEHGGLWGKLTLFEESLHVPLIVCVPGKAPGICSRLVELVDLYPTLAELCGLAAPQGLEGSSFARLLDDPAQPWKKAAFSQVTRNGIAMGRSICTDRYRYNSWADSGQELYDHYVDPHEYNNLANNTTYAAVLADMRKILKDGWTQSLPPLCSDKIWYKDADSDGFGSSADSLLGCTKPAGYVNIPGDFNDADSSIHPGAPERCNSIDDDCDGLIDEDVVPGKVFFRDADGDGFGNAQDSVLACSALPGYVVNKSDCDDTNAAIFPGAPELPDGIDNNCNGKTDEENIYYADADHDGYGSPVNFIAAASIPAGYVNNNFDCNDLDPLTYPNAPEILNGLDDNCNGLIDEGLLPPLKTYFRDADGDGYGDPAKFTRASTTPPGYVDNNTDCNDANAYMNPAAVDLCNGVDDNCNGIIDENDFAASVNPAGNYSMCNGNAVTLTASSGGIYTYQWYKNGVAMPKGLTRNLSTTLAGSYYVMMSDKYYCSAASPVTKVSLLAVPSAAISYTGSPDICSSKSLTLSANNGTGYTYQWMRNGVDISGAVKRQYKATLSGTYTVKVISAGGCSRVSAGLVITNSCGAIPAFTSLDKSYNNAANTATIYPNPSNGYFKLRYNAYEAGKVTINVFDAEGRKVFTNSGEAFMGSNEFSLNLAALAQGMYHLELLTNNKSISLKVSIAR